MRSKIDGQWKKIVISLQEEEARLHSQLAMVQKAIAILIDKKPLAPKKSNDTKKIGRLGDAVLLILEAHPDGITSIDVKNILTEQGYSFVMPTLRRYLTQFAIRHGKPKSHRSYWTKKAKIKTIAA